MKLTVKTLKMQEMVSKAIKGASNNKMMPITGLMLIELKANKLTLTTTDATNYLKIIDDKIEGEDFYAVVPVETFSKLVAKTTAETITLKLTENLLEIKGNGTYNMELPLDEDSNMIKYPDFKFPAKKDEDKKIVNLSTIKTILGANKAALAITMEEPALTGYYCDSKRVVTTDSYKVCNLDVALFDSENPVLISPELMDLLAIIDTENIDVYQSNSKLLFTTPTTIVFGVQLDEKENYPIDAIDSFLKTSFESKCKLPKEAVLAVLDRLSLFISPYDKNAVYLTFNDEGIIFSSKKETGTELIKYQSSENYKPFTCCADILFLSTQIKSQTSEVIELWYGQDSAVKMTSGKITQIVALQEDDRNEA